VYNDAHATKLEAHPVRFLDQSPRHPRQADGHLSQCVREVPRVFRVLHLPCGASSPQQEPEGSAGSQRAGKARQGGDPWHHHDGIPC